MKFKREIKTKGLANIDISPISRTPNRTRPVASPQPVLKSLPTLKVTNKLRNVISCNMGNSQPRVLNKRVPKSELACVNFYNRCIIENNMTIDMHKSLLRAHARQLIKHYSKRRLGPSKLAKSFQLQPTL